MSTVDRRWYAYNGAPGGQHNQLNYFFVTSFPNTCVNSATNICAVLGVYSVTTGSGTTTYGTNPRAFATDPRLDSYITQTFAGGVRAPSGAAQKPYVYPRNF